MDKKANTFKDFANADIDSAFFNDEEFAEKIYIGKNDFGIVPDEVALQEYNSNLTEGLVKGVVLFFVPVNLFKDEELYEEQVIWYKNVRYQVGALDEEMGVYRVVLTGYQS